MKNRVYKSQFKATYPIATELYLETRFMFKQLIPFKICYGLNRQETEYNFLEGLQVMHKVKCNIKNENVGLYEFYITHDNTLVETFIMYGFEKFKLYTQLTARTIQEFYQYIFPLHGVLVFGEFDAHEHYLIRDDVCCKFAHELYPKYTNLKATWWDNKPNINHFFVFEHSDTKQQIKNIMAIGGEPLERGYENIKNTAANFYLSKYINRSGKEAYLKFNDDMESVQEFEKEFIKCTIAALSQEKIPFNIDYIAV